MTADILTSNSIVPLRTSDTGEEALSLMNEFSIRHLPVVNNEQLLGLLSEDDILNYDVKDAVGSYSLSLTRPYVNSHDHIYEVMRVMADYQLTLIPVVDDHGNYVGLIAIEDLLRFFSHTASFTESGSILILEMTRRDYSLTEIARIVESEGATILSVFITSAPSSPRMEVTLKINKQFLHNILATFERFNYNVKASFNESDYFDALKERYDGLMVYLNV